MRNSVPSIGQTNSYSKLSGHVYPRNLPFFKSIDLSHGVRRVWLQQLQYFQLRLAVYFYNFDRYRIFIRVNRNRFSRINPEIIIM